MGFGFRPDNAPLDTVSSASIQDLTIQAIDIALGAIGASQIATGAVTSLKIADGTVTSTDILDGTITAADLVADTLTAAQLAAGSVGTSEVIDDSLTASDLATDAVDAAEIKASAVGTSEVADDTLTASDLATDAVGAAEIAADAVTASEIATDAVDAAEIKDGAVTASELAAGSITAADAAADMATQAELDAVVAGSVTDESITSNKLADDAFAQYRSAMRRQGFASVADGNEYALLPNGDFANISGTNASCGMFYLDPTDFESGSRDAKVRLRSTVATGSVGPGTKTGRVMLRPVTSVSSGALTLGAAIATNDHLSMVASDYDVLAGSDSSLTAGWYVVTFTFLTGVGAATSTGVVADVQVRQQ
jgi:hypothetical protein